MENLFYSNKALTIVCGVVGVEAAPLDGSVRVRDVHKLLDARQRDAKLAFVGYYEMAACSP